VPVIPCYLQGAFEACPAGRIVPLHRKIRMHVGPALRFADVPDKRAGWETITARLEEAVQRLGGELGETGQSKEPGATVSLSGQAASTPSVKPGEPQITTSSEPSGG
jgi:hypothetical protein